MARLFLALVAGLVFGTGILISGMANPAKVLNFFDLAGSWDPSLAFVMGGAVAVTALGYRLAFSRGRPLLAARFHLPTARDVDARLVLGSAVFGVGWGIAGFCPGGAIPALVLGRIEPLVFVVALMGGLAIGRAIDGRLAAPGGATTA